MWSCNWSGDYFFFQAEDGIRDLTVTGVQTCALPISLERGKRLGVDDEARHLRRRKIRKRRLLELEPRGLKLRDRGLEGGLHLGLGSLEIGRASCRERV